MQDFKNDPPDQKTKILLVKNQFLGKTESTMSSSKKVRKSSGEALLRTSTVKKPRVSSKEDTVSIKQVEECLNMVRKMNPHKFIIYARCRGCKDLFFITEYTDERDEPKLWNKHEFISREGPNDWKQKGCPNSDCELHGSLKSLDTSIFRPEVWKTEF